MILSVSRRTDIPNYYSDWFYNRINEQYLYVRNPMNAHQVSKINISPDVVDCIVFWTKNPEPMLERLVEISDYNYYFQFTLTGYGRDIERNIPHKKEHMIPIFQKLSQKIGAKKVIWRYDPIIFTEKYTPEYHIKAFEQIAVALRGYTQKCVISFVDIYLKNKKNMNAINAYDLPESQLIDFVTKLKIIAEQNDMSLCSCAEKIDLEKCGVSHNSCIDKVLIEEITGCKLKVDKDKNQRQDCGCIESVEVGTYNTCKNGCIYCYANYDGISVAKNSEMYDVNSPILCGVISEDDKVTERKVKSLFEKQIDIFDFT